MRIDFSELGDVESFVNIPPGQYLCSINDVRKTHTRDGSPRWLFRLDVADGPYAGRIAGWDSLNWSERGLHRVREVLHNLGVDARGVVDIEPEDIDGRRVLATFEEEVRHDELSGKEVHRLRVPYRGYRPAEAPGTNGAA